jgi:hypothetical protein
MNKLFQSILLGSAIAMCGFPALTADRDRGVSVSLGGIDANVGLDAGGRRGLDADVDVSIGGRNGLDADADVSVGGRKGVNADVDVSLGNRNGLDADVDVSLGGRKGLDADVGATIGNGVGADVDLSLGDNNANVDVDLGGTDPGTTPGIDPDDKSDRPRLTTAQRQAFNRLSAADKAVLLKRCGSVSAGGYDPALVELCKLLRMSAAR